jgi:hypothetical protein
MVKMETVGKGTSGDSGIHFFFNTERESRHPIGFPAQSALISVHLRLKVIFAKRTHGSGKERRQK